MPLSLSTNTLTKDGSAGSGTFQDISNILLAEAIDNIEPAAPNKELVTNITIPSGHYQVTVPIYGRTTAAALTEGVDISPVQGPEVANVVTQTASEHGVMTFVSDRLAYQGNDDAIAVVGEQHGRAVGRLLDQDIIGLFDGFSNSIGAANTDLNLASIAVAVGFLRSDDSTYGPAPNPINASLHPEQIRRLLTDVAGQAASISTFGGNPIPTGLSEDVVKNYMRGRDPLFGVPIIESPNISRDSNDDAKGAVLSQRALHLAMEQEIRAEEERDASLRGTEIVTVGVWGQGETVDVWGVEMLGDAESLVA
tara:strand:- start:3617 stop:4543 length:927 start_codon:yes stop_codon:yes gene_type:complete